MHLRLDGPWAKVDRALEHLKAIDLGCHVFLETKPYYITAQFEPDAGHHVVRLRVRQGVPLVLSVVVGDFLHDLRSALDQAAWLIACRSNPVEELWQDNIASQIAYPFVRDPTKLGDNGLMCRIADDAKAVLDKTQPYQRTDRSQGLDRLNRLWNIDKHRVLHGGFSAIDLTAVTFRQAALFIEQFAESRIEFVWGRDRIAEDGTRIANAYFSGAPEGVDPVVAAQTAKVDVKGEPSAQIFFGSGGGGRGYSLNALAQMVEYVADTLGEIATLPEKPSG